MDKLKVEVLGAVIDGKGKGETVEIDERSAKHFEKVGYARILPKPKPEKPSSEKGQSAPKKGGAKSGTKQTKQTKQTTKEE